MVDGAFDLLLRTWRRRFARGGMPLCATGPAAACRGYGPDVRLQIVAAATSAPPEGVTAWTHALIAGQLAWMGISVSQIGRILADTAARPVRGWLNRRDDDQFWAQAAASATSTCARRRAPW